MLGLISHSFAQGTKEADLPEVEVLATNYKYLNSVSPEKVADISVKTLEEKVANFNLKDAEFYSDDYELYSVQFYIPNGKILAAYDKEGKLLRTVEKFKDVRLPNNVMKAVGERFPNWRFTKDVYFVKYHESSDKAKKFYKIKLENGDKTLRVKVDEDGNFL